MPTVFAHTQLAGMNDFWNGALHPFLTPAHVVLLVALGLYLGQRAPRNVAPPAVAFAASCGLGLVWVIARPLTSISQAVPLTIAMLPAILIAVDRSIPRILAIVVYAAGGSVIGLDFGVDHATLAAAAKMSLGTWLSVCFLVFNVAFYTARFTRQWQRLGVRVAASWILAISMLVLAFAIRR